MPWHPSYCTATIDTERLKRQGFQVGNKFGGRKPSPNLASVVRNELLELFRKAGGVQLLQDALAEDPMQFFERLILPIILRAKDDHMRLEMLQSFCTAAGLSGKLLNSKQGQTLQYHHRL